ncbi:MAG: hypothetical protein JWQ25_1040 [Daejeonella sp.]|nr:hypothetical protein [Daejeonella sp.]
MDAQMLSKFNLFRNVVEQFVPFNDEEWAIFQSHLKSLSLKKKECFVEAGKVCHYVGYIVSGSVRCYHIKDGTEITSYFSLENEMITSYKSFLNKIPSPNTIESLEKTEMIVFDLQSLHELTNNKLLSLKMERFGRLIAEFLIFCYEDRITSFVTLSPEERYLNLLAKSSNVIQRIPQHYIANYLGITPVSLSRIRRRIMEPSKNLREVLN